ncbi:hypothetical protein [Aureimonas phyllosphaerae]|uniref:Uncharacterized protein n=1 Tax=Aureimonas phyllosphaerae TaxID=1166078 RepID=A0A7W6FV83_9HYPH|nr:hypothetical protein [Aureimonas phyllosphaerae]MBB3936555.1 hypothetical protein [Aureimonas phyllosphaerae]MBB3960581.1 hypothetical protein [Aureimonas phyllosphaerae]SFF57887.1 hypothetical protein SAMN05216566_13512 [Aureimonas phyllosphaerae]
MISKSSLLGSASSNVVPLAAIPGWTGPVLAAKRSAPRDGLVGPAFSLRGADHILAGRGAALADQVNEIMTEARALGASFGLQLFTETIECLAAETAAASEQAYESELIGNIPATLKRFESTARQITLVHAVAGGSPNEAGYAHWAAARAAYGREVVRLVGGLLFDFAAELGTPDAADVWCEDLSDVVMAFVFPGDGESPKDDAWRGKQATRFENIRRSLIKHRIQAT